MAQVEEYREFALETDYIVGTWDDHDYGLNNAGKEFEHMEVSLSKSVRVVRVCVDIH